VCGSLLDPRFSVEQEGNRESGKAGQVEIHRYLPGIKADSSDEGGYGLLILGFGILQFCFLVIFLPSQIFG
jgi:hypothetical protein